MPSRRIVPTFGFCLAALVAATPALALDDINFSTGDMSDDLRSQLKSNSALVAAQSENRDTGQDIIAAALSDYGIFLETLYANGYYGPTISIRIDGREASEIALLDTPANVGQVTVTVDSGPNFDFGTARVSPLAPGTELPAEFATGQRARASLVGEAASAAVDGWREIGHAKAEIADQTVTANYSKRLLNVDVRVDPGRQLRFGKLNTDGDSYVRSAAQRRIAGLPEGEVFSPDEVKRVVNRLTRTRAFSTVTLREAETPNPDGTLDMILDVTDAKPRRFGFGAEISSLEGLTLSTFWLHRNLAGGAERFRVDAEISDISGNTDEIDGALTARLDVPAAYGPDIDAFFQLELTREQEPLYDSSTAEFTTGLHWRYDEHLTAEVGIGLLYSETDDDLGHREFTLLTFPSSVTYDKRDNDLDPRGGWYAAAELTPFYDIDGAGSGARLYTDLRGYYGLGEAKRTVFAGRLQLGSVVGPSIEDTQPEFLFYSGGAGTVRGQPFQSLFVDLGGGIESGGRSFVGLSGEVRQDIGENWGVVLFADAGFVGSDSTPGSNGDWHSGAGIGVRYKTGIGPIRFDIAAPTGGDTGEGVQVYIGIGQSF